MNAMDYIRKSAVIDGYPWIKNLVEDVLTDVPISETIGKLIFETPLHQAATIESPMMEESEHATYEDVPVGRIVSLDKVRNVGLLDLDDRLMFGEGLNILYGKNGAGKSSVYSALCRVLGKQDNRVFPSLYSDTELSSVEITYTDVDEREHSLKWNTGMKNQGCNVQVFDSNVANVLVEQDQVNDFDLAHLKFEYFSYITNMFDELQTKLQEAKTYQETTVAAYRTTLSDKAPFVLTVKELSQEWLDQQGFTEDDQQELDSIDQALAPFQLEPTGESIKNVENARIAVERILTLLCVRTQDEGWVLRYNERYFERANQLINDYDSAKSIFATGNGSVGALPRDWVNNELWQAFISASIEFVNSLGANESEFTDQTCVYCLQPLQSDQSRELMIRYRALQNEHAEKLKTLEHELLQNAAAIGKVIQSLSDCYETVAIVESTFEQIGRKDQTVIPQIEIMGVLGQIKNAFDSKLPMSPTEYRHTFDSFYNYYIVLWTQLNDVVKVLRDSVEGRTRQKEELLKRAEPLRQRLALQEVKQNVLSYIDGLKSIQRLDAMLADVSGARRAISTLKTRFTNEEVLKSFEQLLKEEYRNFDFQPPDVWRLRSSTSRDVTKRVYSLSDRKLSQIFSEGERKIHALADFFAECELNQFVGVYIFDDPVNSLDEDKMEYVARRIVRVVEEGNQVFVFTHNLVFLNLLMGADEQKISNITRINRKVLIDSNMSLGDNNVLRRKLEEIDRRMEEFAKKGEGHISEWELRNVYDLMSGYIEDYVEIVLLRNIINRYRPNIRMHSLGNLESLDTSVVGSILELYNQTSRKGSRHSQPVGAPGPMYGELSEHVRELKENFHYRPKKQK